MALVDLQAAIADEMDRSDLGTQITREINNAIRWYEYEKVWFSDSTMQTITTVQGQRLYALPANFLNVQTVRGTIGNYTYLMQPRTIQYIEEVDWGNNFWSSYPTDYAIWQNQIRLFPPPSANLPIQIDGTVLLPTLTTTAPTKPYAANTAYNLNDTVFDSNNNIETCITPGTTQAAPTNSYAANTAYVVNNTVLDSNGNLQKCTAPGTSGAIAPTWSTIYGGVTIDNEQLGPLQWTLIKLQWSTNYLTQTIDGSVVWQLTGANDNPWTEAAEELIRDRALRNLYGRYVKSNENYQMYTQFEQEALANLRQKNHRQITSGWLRPHI